MGWIRQAEWGLVLAVCALAAQAQVGRAAAEQPEPVGTVVGHVFCDDTNGPARFARVSLQGVPAPRQRGATGTSKADSAGGRSGAVAAGTKSGAGDAGAKAGGGGQGTTSVSTTVETGLDGSFALHDVKPGEYFVVTEKAGYVSPQTMFSADDLSDSAPEMREMVGKALHRIKVDPNATARVDLTLERGAAVSGTVLFDDGSPAAEMELHLLHKDANGKWIRVQQPRMRNFNDVMTDDRGRYRLANLLADEYMVETRMNLQKMVTRTVNQGTGKEMGTSTQNSLFDLSFYGRGEVTKKAAKSFTVLAGQERTGEDVTIPLSKLHRVTGRVLAGTDAHPVNAARVVLLTREDGQQMASVTVLRDDGLFHFEFVPAGEYTLRVENARDVVWEPGEDPTHGAGMPVPVEDKEKVVATYGGVERPLDLPGDLLGLDVVVPAKK